LYSKVDKPSTTPIYTTPYLSMGAIWWGTGGVSTHFFRRGDIICHVLPTFLSLGFVFGEVLKIKAVF